MSLNPEIQEPEDKVSLVSFICKISEEELMEMTPTQFGGIFNQVMNIIDKLEVDFRPVIKWNGVDYGYQPMHKMAFGEMVDLKNLMKDSVELNMYDIISILYRPIKTNNLRNLKYTIKSAYKIATSSTEIDFDYYEVEPYNVVKRKQQAEIMNDFPAEIAIGGLNFFTIVNQASTNNIQISSLQTLRTLMKTKKNKMTLSQNIMAGLQQWKHLQIPTF